MTMQKNTTEIHDYARSLYEAHGEKSLVEAAQKARDFEKKGKADEARTWRQIEATIKEIRGPHQS